MMVVLLRLLLLLMSVRMMMNHRGMMVLQYRYTVVTGVIEIGLGGGDVVRRIMMQMITMRLTL